MNSSQIAKISASDAKSWLKNRALPFWKSYGVDPENAGFVESIELTGEPKLKQNRRAMVQARQVYSFRKAYELELLPKDEALKIAQGGIHYLLAHHSLDSGAFRHSTDPSGQNHGETLDLYAQAFSLFGLAHAYYLFKSEKYKIRALKLLDYLNDQRSLSEGGFAEWDENKTPSLEANPHMHLFESAIAWMQVDSEPVWKKLADDILSLCLERFIEKDSGLLSEYFDANWEIRKIDGRFIYEPGHQHEWAWLIGEYQEIVDPELKNQKLNETRQKLFDLSEEYGLCKTTGALYDEMWSDHSPKAATQRFWPPCERMKSAMSMARHFPNRRETYLNIAQDSLNVLFQYFNTPINGQWYDVQIAPGEFKQQPAKASSLYHIIGALNEFFNP